MVRNSTTAGSGAPRSGRASQRDKVRALLEELAGQVEQLRTRAGWLAMLRGAVGLHKYSVNNQMLLSAQGAARGFTPSQVAGFQAWKDMGRAVRKGEAGLAVLAPSPRLVPIKDDDEVEATEVIQTRKGPCRRVMGFRVTYVWDRSQTEGITESDVEPVTSQDAAAEPDPAALARVRGDLEQRLRAMGYTVTYADPGGGRLGTTQPRTRQVTIAPNDDDQRAVLTTLAHELAHVQLGHTDTEYDYRAHRGPAEVAAESVAFVVLGAHGIDAGDDSVSYVAGWAGKDDDAVRAAAEAVTMAAHTILTPPNADAEAEDIAGSTPGPQRSEVPTRGASVRPQEEGTEMPRVRYGWRISYTDRPVDLIYDQQQALRVFGERHDARELRLVRFTHHDDSTVTSEDLGASGLASPASTGAVEMSIGAARAALRGLQDVAVHGAARVENLAASLTGADLDAATLGEVATLLDAADNMRDAAVRALTGLDARHAVGRRGQRHPASSKEQLLPALSQ